MQHDTIDLHTRLVLGNYGRFPLALSRGLGSRVWDEAGREYLDFCTGIAVCSLGHCHPRLVEALRVQAGELMHISNLYYNRPQAEAARRLVEIVGHRGRVFFCNSGAEANEAAYKIARKFAHVSRPAGHFAATAPQILTFTNSFHGRTLAGIAATGQDKVKVGFDPLTPGFRHLPFNDIASLESAIFADTVAILLEPVQGEGGIHLATPQFLRAARRLCDEHNLLLLLDEVQSGLGRCGEMNAWHAVGAPEIAPDVVTWAKGMGGGFPIGAAWFGERPVKQHDGGADIELHALLGPGSHGTTYGGSPLGSAVVSTVLDVIESDGLCENARDRGAQAVKAIRALGSPAIKEVRGAGLLIGIELDPSCFADDGEGSSPPRTPALSLVHRLIKHGLLVPPAGPNVIRWLPPLTVTAAEIDEAAQKLQAGLEDFSECG